MVEYLLLDLDDTILDFHRAEREALSRTLRQFGLEPTGEILALYHRINKAHWEMLERRELTRDQVNVGRFEELFQRLGVRRQGAAVADVYLDKLSRGHWFLPGAVETLEALQGRYRLFLASNGTAQVQRSRLESAGIGTYFEQIFISQELGYDKPAREFFQGAFARIPGFDRERALMVGDSLTSDIRGGKNAGIRTCWINPEGKQAPGDCMPDHQLASVAELPGLLENME